MKPRTLRNLLMLTEEAERKIREAGLEPPPGDYLMAALLPHARTVTRAARALERSARLHGQAQVLARQCAAAAVEMADAVADAVIEATPAVAAPQRFDPARCTPFDPAKFTVTLTTNPGSRQPALTAGDLS